MSVHELDKPSDLREEGAEFWAQGGKSIYLFPSSN